MLTKASVRYAVDTCSRVFQPRASARLTAAAPWSCASPNLPAPIAARLNSEIVRILKSPDVVEILGQSGLEVIANAQSDFAAMIEQDAKLWDEAAVMAGLVPAEAVSSP